MMDHGYVVMAVVFGLIALIIWSSRARWNGKREDFRHNPLPGHRHDEGRQGDGVFD
jgi:hypothetical protein